MASPIWIGGAPAVAQIDTVAIPTDIEAGQTVTFIIGYKTLSVTLTGTTQSAVVTELMAAWNASTIPEFAEIIASVGTDANDEEDGTINLTSRTAGKPFAVTTSIGTGNNEKQVITLGGTAATGGTFTLTYNDETTTPIAYNASAATVQSALEGLASYSSGDFTVTGSVAGPWTVEFTGTLAGTNVSIMTIDVTGLTGGVNEVQTITSPNNPTGGTFKLSYLGETTSAIAYNASASAIESALEALSNIPTGSVSCASGALPGTNVTVTFQDNLKYTDVAILEVDSSNLTGVTGTVTETQTGGSTLADKAVNFWKFENNVQSQVDVIDGKAINIDFFTGTGEIVSGGVKGNCIYNDGYISTVESDDNTTGRFNEDEPFSITFWFKSGDTGGKILLSHKYSSIYNFLVQTVYESISDSGTVNFQVRKSTGMHSVTSSDVLTKNAWNLITLVWDPDNTQISVGVNGSTFASTTGLTVGVLPANTQAYLNIWGGTYVHRFLIHRQLGNIRSAINAVGITNNLQREP